MAAQACILLLNRKPRYYPGLRSILIYPHAYIAKRYTRMGSVTLVDNDVNLGESWDTGAVVLAWDSVQHGLRDLNDGHNVVLHEFAHQLDQEDGKADGIPVVGRGMAPSDQAGVYTSRARMLSEEYEELNRKIKKGRKT